MKKILVIVGGGRPRGNTAQLVDAFIRGAQEAGHQVEKVSLLQTEVKGAWAATPAAMESPASRRMGSRGLPIKSWPPI